MSGHRHLLSLMLPVVLALLCGVIALAYWMSSPRIVVIGIVDNASNETVFLKAFAAHVRPERHNLIVRLKTFQQDTDLRAAFRTGVIDVAAFASTEALPEVAETVVVLERTRVYLLTLSSSDAPRKPDGATTALVAETEAATQQGRLVLAAIAGGENAPVEVMQVRDAARALQTGQIAAIAIAASNPTAIMRPIVAALSPTQRDNLALLPMPRPDELQRQASGVEPVAAKVGSLWSSPVLPDEEIEIASVTTRLMARAAVPEEVVGLAARAILGSQRRLSPTVPAASRIEPPPIDRASVIPTHAGALAYLEGNESTFIDRFGDWIYLGLFGASGLGSIFAGLVGWRNTVQRRADVRRLQALQALITESREAATLAELELLHARYAQLMDGVVGAATRLEINQTDFLAFMMANTLYLTTHAARSASLSDAPVADGRPSLHASVQRFA